MEEEYSMDVMRGVVAYMSLLGLMVFGGVAAWEGYRVLGIGLIVVSAALLVWLAAGAPI
ncbi:MAG TPA: hypothetical protein VH835_14825 [Dongiaceae bacterium]|jgi:hypothetical protein